MSANERAADSYEGHTRSCERCLFAARGYTGAGTLDERFTQLRAKSCDEGRRILGPVQL